MVGTVLLKTERWIPVDSMVCPLVERIRSLRPPTVPKTGRLLLFWPRGRKMLVRRIRVALREVVSAVGIPARIVPHQFRHTDGMEMLRASVGFPAVMRLLGHKSPDVTLEYLQITQRDLQREFHLALFHPRHLAPSPILSSSPPRADLSSLIDSLTAAQHVLEVYRRSVADYSARRLLNRLANRVVKVLAETRKLNAPKNKHRLPG